MATRSAIVEVTEDGKYRAVYCHNDGYPEYNGLMLERFYNTKEKVKELIDLGFISSLSKKVKPDENEPHSFSEPAENVSIFYHRDRNDDFEHMAPMVGDTIDEALSNIEYCYVYIFKDNEWYVDDGVDGPVLVKSLELDTKYVD